MFTVRENETPVLPGDAQRRVSLTACIGSGAAFAVLALLPWLVTGMRLPLQNLWAAQTLPQDMPIALMPLSQYAITQVLAILVVGYGSAGVLARAIRPRLPRGAVLGLAGGALAVHLVVAVQALTTVASGLRERTASDVYLAALVAVVVASVLIGLLVLRMLTAPSRAAAVLGLCSLGLVGASWLESLLTALSTVSGEGPSAAVFPVLRWVPAVVVGATIAWGGCGTTARSAPSVLGLLLLWLVPAALTALSSAVGSRVLLPYPREVVSYGLEVLRAATFDSALVLPPLLLALVIAAAGIVARRLLGRPVVPQDT